MANTPLIVLFSRLPKPSYLVIAITSALLCHLGVITHSVFWLRILLELVYRVSQLEPFAQLHLTYRISTREECVQRIFGRIRLSLRGRLIGLFLI